MKRLIIGNSNCGAVSLAEDFIDSHSKKILWIHGRSGYGKTELANYLIRRFEDNDKKGCLFATEDFINSVLEIIKERGSLGSLMSYCGDYDLLVFDNTDLTLYEKPKTQEEFKRLILEIIKNGKTKVVLITNKKPRRLRKLMFDTQNCHYARLKIPTTDLKIGLLNDWALQNRTLIPGKAIIGLAKASKNLFQLKGLFHQIHFKYDNL